MREYKGPLGLRKVTLYLHNNEDGGLGGLWEQEIIMVEFHFQKTSNANTPSHHRCRRLPRCCRRYACSVVARRRRTPARQQDAAEHKSKALAVFETCLDARVARAAYAGGTGALGGASVARLSTPSSVVRVVARAVEPGLDAGAT